VVPIVEENVSLNVHFSTFHQLVAEFKGDEIPVEFPPFFSFHFPIDIRGIECGKIPVEIPLVFFLPFGLVF
jgi:hypothetical protein